VAAFQDFGNGVMGSYISLNYLTKVARRHGFPLAGSAGKKDIQPAILEEVKGCRELLRKPDD
jgi:hypothetical protein